MGLWKTSSVKGGLPGRGLFRAQRSVLIVDDVKPYELMKLRLLNSSHSAMAYVSLLACHTFVDEALHRYRCTYFLESL